MEAQSLRVDRGAVPHPKDATPSSLLRLIDGSRGLGSHKARPHIRPGEARVSANSRAFRPACIAVLRQSFREENVLRKLALTSAAALAAIAAGAAPVPASAADIV